jgi:hypothetical protein
MPSYWRVAPRFWTDPAMRRADDDTRMLALYLLTCPHRNVIGLFWLPKTYMCADLGWDAKRLGKPFGQLLSAGFHAYDEEAEVTLIRNALKYQAPENDNQVVAAIRHLEDLPATFLASEFRGLAERFCERLAKALPDGFGQPLPDPTTPTTATPPATDQTVVHGEVEPTTPVVEQARPIDDITHVFRTWQEATRKHRAQLDPKRRRRIKAALAQYPLQDVLDAVRGWQHSPHHCGQNNTATVYNDLDLLLRDAEHLERFRDLWRDGPAPVVSKQTAQAIRTSQAMRARAEEVNRDVRGMGRLGGQAQRGLPQTAD